MFYRLHFDAITIALALVVVAGCSERPASVATALPVASDSGVDNELLARYLGLAPLPAAPAPTPIIFQAAAAPAISPQFVSLAAASEDDAAAEKERVFWVYRDSGEGNLGEWSNFMPAEAGGADGMLSLDLVNKDDPARGASCVKVTVKFKPPNWAGIMVSSGPDYWGKTDGPAFDLSDAERLVFSAKGLKGGESIQAKFAICDEKFGDSAKPGAATSFLTLDRTWRKFELDLRRAGDKSRIISPFVFVTSRPQNDADEITFFLDEIHIVRSGGR